MSKCYDEFEAGRDITHLTDVEFVPETQFEPIRQKFHSGTSSLNTRLREVVANQRPGKQISFEGKVLSPCNPVGPTLPSGAYPVCRCGDECVVVVAKTETNAGRRFYGCASYEDHMMNHGEVGCCKFMKWIDPPLCARGVEYALEMQAEVRRLKKLVEEMNRKCW